MKRLIFILTLIISSFGLNLNSIQAISAAAETPEDCESGLLEIYSFDPELRLHLGSGQIIQGKIVTAHHVIASARYTGGRIFVRALGTDKSYRVWINTDSEEIAKKEQTDAVVLNIDPENMAELLRPKDQGGQGCKSINFEIETSENIKMGLSAMQFSVNHFSGKPKLFKTNIALLSPEPFKNPPNSYDLGMFIHYKTSDNVFQGCSGGVAINFNGSRPKIIGLYVGSEFGTKYSTYSLPTPLKKVLAATTNQHGTENGLDDLPKKLIDRHVKHMKMLSKKGAIIHSPNLCDLTCYCAGYTYSKYEELKSHLDAISELLKEEAIERQEIERLAAKLKPVSG